MSAPELSALEAIMVEVDDLELFPEEVVAAYKDGPHGPRKARKLFARHLRATDDPTRVQQRQEFYDNLRLWSWDAGNPANITLNGIGTRTYGSSHPDPRDGSYITTQWFTLLLAPIFPIQSLWVSKTPDGKTLVRGAVEHPPGVGQTQRLVFGIIAVCTLAFGGLIVLNLAALAGMVWMAGYDADVVLYNGFSHPIEVTADSRSFTVPGRSHLEVELPAEVIRAKARLGPDGPVVDDRELDLSEAGWSTAIYNVGGRGVLFRQRVIYGQHFGDEPEPELLAVPLTVVRSIDYILEDPPEEIRIEGNSAERTWLFAPVVHSPPQQQLEVLLGLDAVDAATQLAYAALTAGHDDPILLAVAVGLEGPPEQRLERCTALLAQRPEAIDRARFCQDIQRAEAPQATLSAYTQRAEEEPESPAAQYLLGRLLSGENALAKYERALDLDPEFSRAHLAIAWELEATGGDMERALTHILSAKSIGFDPDENTRELELRIRRRLGETPVELADRFEGTDPRAYTLSDMLRLQEDRSRYAADQARVAALADELGPARVATLQGTIALIARRSEDLHRFNAAGANLDLLAALGTDATPEEQAWSCSTDNPPADELAVFCWLHQHLQGRESAPFSAHFPVTVPHLAPTLADGDALQADDLRVSLHDAHPHVRAAAWYAGWRLTGDPAFLAEAEAWAMPPDLPIH